MYEAKRQEFHAQCQREEEELKQMFMQRVKEKELTFKDAEKEARITHLTSILCVLFFGGWAPVGSYFGRNFPSL